MNQIKLKETKENKPDLENKLWLKAYRRYCIIYKLLVLLYIAFVYSVWSHAGKFYGVVAMFFGLWCWYWYEDGASEKCVDECEYAYPIDGFKRLFKTLPWFIIPFYILYQIFH